MNRICSKIARVTVLQAAILALLFAIVPAIAQNSGGVTTNTGTPLINPNDPLLKGSDLTTQSTSYAGTNQDVQIRKDAWTWYWNEKAHIDINPNDTFWGDDIVSNFFRNISNKVFIPFWNAAMEYDFVRAGLLLIIAGMLLGIGASIVMPKKKEDKGKGK